MKKSITFLLFILLSFNLNAESDQTNLNEATELVNPSANIDVPGQVFASGEILYWTAKQNNLFYGQTVQYLQSGSDAYVRTLLGDLEKVEPKWHSGFRIKIGVNLHHDNWDYYTDWTRYHAKSNDSTKNTVTTLWGTTSRQVAGFSRDSSAEWALGFDSWTLDLGRNSWVGKYLVLRPHFGVKGAVISQKMTVQYNYLQLATVSSSNPLFKGKIKPRSIFAGTGLEGGLDLIFFVQKHWGIYLNSEASMLYGRFNCNFIEWQDDLTNHEYVCIGRSRDNFYQGIAGGRINMGLTFGSYLFDEKAHLMFRAGWEENIWFGVNKIQHFVHKLDEGKMYQQNQNLSLQGLVINLRADF